MLYPPTYCRKLKHSSLYGPLKGLLLLMLCLLLLLIRVAIAGLVRAVAERRLHSELQRMLFCSLWVSHVGARILSPATASCPAMMPSAFILCTGTAAATCSDRRVRFFTRSITNERVATTKRPMNIVKGGGASYVASDIGRKGSTEEREDKRPESSGVRDEGVDGSMCGSISRHHTVTP